MNHPLVLILLTLGGWYAGKLWLDDWRSTRRGTPHPPGLPGATSASPRLLFTAIGGALALVAIETAGEYLLGVAGEQSRMTWLFALYSMTAAPIVEELIFRGWIVVENRGRVMMWIAAAGASIAFALLHPFLWRWDDAGFALTLTTKGGFSCAIVFLTSLWLYAVRLGTWNPQRSLLPCFAAHAAKNVAVVAIKAATGFMAGPW